MKVAFYQPFMNERGTCVAMFDYAHFNETLLGNESVFIYDSLDIRNQQSGLDRIKNRFETFDIRCANYDNDNAQIRTQKIDQAIELAGITHIYMCKSGYNDGVIPTKAKVLIHIMGMVDPSHNHGDVWAYVSDFSSRMCSNYRFPFVPYMVHLPEENGDFRNLLSIPKDSIVVGRHGGIDTFDIWWAKNSVAKAVNDRKDLYFVFLNTPVFINHPRIIFLDTIVDPIEKMKFINSCDVMLHARDVGETFGMAPAEFSAAGKPVMTAFFSKERNHIEILGDKGLYYDSEESLYNMLMNFKVNKDIDWNCYKEYSPEKVIAIFEKVYLGV